MNETDLAAEAAQTPPRAALLAALARGAYPVVPETLTAAVAALDAGAALQRKIQDAQVETLSAFTARTAAEALAGRGLPRDFPAAVDAAQRANDRRELAIRAAAVVRAGLDNGFTAAVTDALPDLLAGLRTALTEVTAGLRAADKALGALDVADPEQVAAAGEQARAALLTLGDLRHRYDGLRYAQRVALRASSVKPPNVTPLSVGLGWPQVLASGVHEFADVRKLGRPAPHGTSTARFRRLASRRDAWIPTTEELATAWARLNAPERGPVSVEPPVEKESAA